MIIVIPAYLVSAASEARIAIAISAFRDDDLRYSKHAIKKNISKMRKSDSDINIEYTSSRQGLITIHVNIAHLYNFDRCTNLSMI